MYVKICKYGMQTTKLVCRNLPTVNILVLSWGAISFWKHITLLARKAEYYRAPLIPLTH